MAMGSISFHPDLSHHSMKDKSVPERTANEETKIYSKDYINVVIQIPLKYISIALSVLSGLHLCFIEFRLYFPADTVAK